MHVIALRAALIEVSLALHVQQVQFIDQSLPLQQGQGAIDGDAVDRGIYLGSLAQNLCGVEVLFCRFDDFQDDTALPGQADSAAQQNIL